MQPIHRHLLFGLVLSAAAVWLAWSAPSWRGALSLQPPAPQVGFAAPDFTLSTAAGEKTTLAAQRGKAVLVNHWATWCPPCRAEMPAIERLYQEYRSRGFIVLAINSTFQDDSSAIVPFVDDLGLSFPILLTSGCSRA
jgi:thiol-disulfide isomerase/thioredoxin